MKRTRNDEESVGVGEWWHSDIAPLGWKNQISEIHELCGKLFYFCKCNFDVELDDNGMFKLR